MVKSNAKGYGSNPHYADTKDADVKGPNVWKTIAYYLPMSDLTAACGILDIHSWFLIKKFLPPFPLSVYLNFLLLQAIFFSVLALVFCLIFSQTMAANKQLIFHLFSSIFSLFLLFMPNFLYEIEEVCDSIFCLLYWLKNVIFVRRKITYIFFQYSFSYS